MLKLFHMKRFTSKTQKTGEIGEKISVIFLKNKGFNIEETNYTKKVGEIDIIATKDKVLHFIEVKSINKNTNVSYETYNPAENLTKKKYNKIIKTINIYFEENKVSHETRWQIDLYCIFIDRSKNKKHKISILENIIL